MKNIKSCTDLEKYCASDYTPVSDGIFSHQGEYVTALSFEQEPELGEGGNAAEISQYPLEDLLDRFMVYVSDYFEEYNVPGNATCLLEFSGDSEEDIAELRTIIGRHVYNRERVSDGKTYIDLIVE